MTGGAGEHTHTPGPWFIQGTLEPMGGGLAQPVLAQDTFIAHVILDDEDDAEARANARLIAAAPELLEALESAEAVIDYAASILWNCRPEGRQARPAKVDAALRQFRAAIAKARGQA